jgi:hypothetical protein
MGIAVADMAMDIRSDTPIRITIMTNTVTVTVTLTLLF